MRKFLLFVFVTVFIIIFIPVIVLGGVGKGINIPGIINSLPNIISKNETKIDPSNIKVKVYDAKNDKIIELELEEYLKGVVCAEMPVLFDIEALKAQAVAARTYTIAQLKVSGGSGCSRNTEADVCNEVHCQAWMSKEERFKGWVASEAEDNWKRIEEAVKSTAGIVITYDGKLASSIKYFSTSGGRTEDSINVFGYSQPYLKSVESPDEEVSPSYTSTVSITRGEFISRMQVLSPKIKLTNTNLATQIKIETFTEGGSVKSIKIGDKSFTGIDIRWAMGLKSANFTIKVDTKKVTFIVKGYGHGVGMSQWGANIMGKKGIKYDAIIKHYYQGTELKKISDVTQNNK